MIFRQLTRSDREPSAALWRVIFNDSEAFTDWYFNARFCAEHSFGAFDGDRLVAMTLGRNTAIRVEDRLHDALLIAGVSTLPEYRKKGLMHKLLSMQTEHAKNAGFSCCYLHPVTESLYASLGFLTGTDAVLAVSDPARGHKPFTLKEGIVRSDLLTVYDTLMKTHDGMELRDAAEMERVFADYASDGAKTLIAYAENRPVGYICYSTEDAELFALCPEAYAFLLDEAAKRLGRTIKALAPTDCGLPGERVYGMQYLVFNDSFSLPLGNGFCRTMY